jgi:serine/threonine protein kinase/Tol biopolymer transport system component
MALAPGTKLGPYEVESLLGAGGMGEVYRARDTRLQRDVAIKVLPTSLARDEDRLRRFEQEAKSVAALSHPNLLTVFDVGTLPDPTNASGAAASPYIVSELLEGSTLRARLAEGALGQRKVMDYGVQIASGLAAAHERGIVHRDIKPENIFITKDDRVKILDFGLAKLTQSEFDSQTSLATATNQTELGLVLGTMGYMSPEQLRGKKVDARSDIFSFGAVLYEMLSRRRAFHGDNTADVVSAILNQEPAELTVTNKEISPSLDHIVRHCLEKDPLLRFQSARDLAFQLNVMRETRSSTAIAAISHGEDPKRSRPWMAAASGAVALVLLLAGTWFLARSTAHLEPPKFTQLTFQQGFVEAARFLSDGKNFISASRWGSDADVALFTGTVETPGLRPLGIPVNSLLSVSSTGDLLVLQDAHAIGPGYVRVGRLARLAISGGAPRPLQENVQYADWAPNGTDFAVVRFAPDRHVYRLEYPSGKVLYETPGWISHPRFSRDGKHIAFLDHPVFGDDLGMVAVVDVEGNHKQLSGTFGSTQGLAWSPDQSEIWFSAVKNGIYRSLYATSMRGRERPLLAAPGNVDIQDALPNGNVLLNVTDERLELMVFTPDHPEGRDFTWMDWAYGARFSADSKSILFGDQHSGDSYGTFLRNLDGSPAVRLGDGDPMDLSADNKWAISRLPSKPNQILLLPTGTGESRQLTHSNISHLYGRWLPDGRIVCVGNETGHPERTYLVDMNGNEKALTPEGIVARAVNADGKNLIVSDLDLTQFQLFPVDGGQPRPLSQLQKGDTPQDFTSDDRAILLRRSGKDAAIEIWRLELATSKRTLLHSLSAPGARAVARGLNVVSSRDERSYAYTYHPALSTEYLVQGIH